MSTPYFKKVRRKLSQNCPVMKRLIDLVGPCTMAAMPGEPFTLLVRCVIYQQISTKAAKSIFDKLTTLVGDPSVPIARIKALTEAEFKACGISGPKQRTIRAVVEHVEANSDFLPGIPQHDDETVREHLTQIKGIGPWTADMFMMFGLMRPDILPVGDYGFRTAVQKAFRLRKLPVAERCFKIGEVWKPYRSVATWYLWRSLEPKYQGKE
jgi:DNA-3-methyladenine glycosylase II